MIKFYASLESRKVTTVELDFPVIEGAQQEYLPLHCDLARDKARRCFEGHLNFG